jgi:RNA polymerase primary sigma factor
MDSPLTNSDENKNTLMDVLPDEAFALPDTELLTASLKSEIVNALSVLDKRESEIIRLSFGIGEDHSATLEEIGQRFNLTRERIRQIREKALRKLKTSPKSSKLKSYLG